MITIYYPDGTSRECPNFADNRGLGFVYNSWWFGAFVEIVEISGDGKTIYLDYADEK